jgi:hypothetical protein
MDPRETSHLSISQKSKDSYGRYFLRSRSLHKKQAMLKARAAQLANAHDKGAPLRNRNRNRNGNSHSSNMRKLRDKYASSWSRKRLSKLESSKSRSRSIPLRPDAPQKSSTITPLDQTANQTMSIRPVRNNSSVRKRAVS